MVEDTLEQSDFYWVFESTICKLLFYWKFSSITYWNHSHNQTVYNIWSFSQEIKSLKIISIAHFNYEWVINKMFFPIPLIIIFCINLKSFQSMWAEPKSKDFLTTVLYCRRGTWHWRCRDEWDILLELTIQQDTHVCFFHSLGWPHCFFPLTEDTDTMCTRELMNTSKRDKWQKNNLKYSFLAWLFSKWQLIIR